MFSHLDTLKKHQVTLKLLTADHSKKCGSRFLIKKRDAPTYHVDFNFKYGVENGSKLTRNVKCNCLLARLLLYRTLPL